MDIMILPINIQEEKIHKILFPPDGSYVTWIRANNPKFPEFEKDNIRLHLFYTEDEDSLANLLTVSKIYESQIQNYLKDNEGFGDYKRIYLEVDIELLLQYISKEVSVIRDVKGKKNPTIHIWVTLIDDGRIIKDWIESGMPEPWLI